MEVIYNFIISVFLFVWDNSIQIVGSLFVSLAIFEYFYRKYRQREIRKIKKILLKVLEMGKEYNRDDAEHEVLAHSIESLSKEIEENNVLLNTKMDANQRILLTQYNSEFEVLNLRFDGLEKNVIGGISRIKKLEEDTDWIRAIKKYKLILAGLISGIIGVNYYDQIAKFIKSLNIF